MLLHKALVPLRGYEPRKSGVQLVLSEDESDYESNASVSTNVVPTFDGFELVHGLFVGGEASLMDVKGLKDRKITHALSLVTEFEESTASKKIGEKLVYRQVVRLENCADADLLGCVEECCAFIEAALKNKRSRVLVHSIEGESRSISIAVAYLMLHKGLKLNQAYGKVQAMKPSIRINRGFWRQLYELDRILHGHPSMLENDLPGAIIFEKDAIEHIVNEFEKQFDAKFQGQYANIKFAGPAQNTRKRRKMSL